MIRPDRGGTFVEVRRWSATGRARSESWGRSGWVWALYARIRCSGGSRFRLLVLSSGLWEKVVNIMDGGVSAYMMVTNSGSLERGGLHWVTRGR